MTLFPRNKLVLNYHDAILYGSDVAILESNTTWLNDACIHFYLTVLRQQRKDVVFMDPSVVTFLMHQCDDEEDLRDFASGFPQNAKTYVVPINDGHSSSAWRTPGGGSHWSLLVLHRKNGLEGWHFDSMPGNNKHAAAAVMERFRSGVFDPPKTMIVKAAEMTAPRQRNAYDCGIHALAAAQAVSETNSMEEALQKLQTWVAEEETRGGLGPAWRRRILCLVKELC